MGKKRCFVIMPFSKTEKDHTEDYWTNHFEKFLKPLIEQTGELEAYRSEPLRGDILKGIITSLTTDPVVVADLTDHNSNVYWELGIRQSFKHGTITIAEYKTDLPFDLASKATLFYHHDDHIENASFRQKFQNALKDCLSNPERPDSHVLEAITGRGTFYAIIKNEETLRRFDALNFELEYNSKIIKQIDQNLEKNKELRSKNETDLRFHIDLLRSASLEFLFVNRYHEFPDSFFELGGELLEYNNAINRYISKWSESPEWSEKLIKGNIPGILETLGEIKRIFDPVYKKLKNTVI